MTFQRECDATVSPRRQEESCGRSFIGDVIEVVMMFIRLSLVLLPSLLWEEKQKKAVGKWDFPRSVLFSSHVHLEEWRETIIKGGPLKKKRCRWIILSLSKQANQISCLPLKRAGSGDVGNK